MMQEQNIQLTKIKQKLDRTRIEDIPAHIKQEFNHSKLPEQIGSGDRVALTAGSRGITDIKLILVELIKNLKDLGARPFLVPAMGSHGGAVPAGQEEILASYGITESEMEVPIKSSMETVKLGEVGSGVPVYFSRPAREADAIIAVNRVKKHTDFHSPTLESGMSKILVIGLGKHRGARAIHSQGVYGLQELIPEAAEMIIDRTPVLQGIGLVENGYKEISDLVFTPPEEIIKRDGELLEIAAGRMPTLPVDKIDILVVQEMGKDISGTGLDTNIIGRMYINGAREYSRPKVKRLIVLDISEASHGNAIGIGLADITTKKLVDKIDFNDTYKNIITSSFLRRGKIPLTMDSEKEAFELAEDTCWLGEGEIPGVVIIKNTSQLEELYVSAPLLKDIDEDMREIVSHSQLNFTEDGCIRPRLN